MKARRKSDGKQIEVIKVNDDRYQCGLQEYHESELDFYYETTVIQGWVARGEYAVCPRLYTSKPLRQKKGFENGYWSYGMQIGLRLDSSLFPDLTWESEPQEVEIIIKRKKK